MKYLVLFFLAGAVLAYRPDTPALGLGKKTIASVSNETVARDLAGREVRVGKEKWTFPKKVQVAIQEVEVFSVHHGTGRVSVEMTVVVELKGELGGSVILEYNKGESWKLESVDASRLKK